jgi:hypothetical protein
MLILKILDAAFLIGLVAALYWVWKHHAACQKRVFVSNAMPREASRGLVYGFLVILIVGALMVGVYWLL